MLTRKAVWLAGVVAVLTCVMVSAASAQPADRRTYFTFSGPVEVPGATLPAGKYLFHVMDPFFGSKVIQVKSADGDTALAMFLTVAAERMEPADRPEIRFMETPAGTPPAIKTWWYPGAQIGWEFVYPKEQARRLAQATTEPILTTKPETRTPQETEAVPLARLTPRGELDFENSKATPAPPGGAVQYGEMTSPPPAAPEATMARAETPRRLPQTGSWLPLALVFGLSALGAAFALRTVGR